MSERAAAFDDLTEADLRSLFESADYVADDDLATVARFGWMSTSTLTPSRGQAPGLWMRSLRVSLGHSVRARGWRSRRCALWLVSTTSYCRSCDDVTL